MEKKRIAATLAAASFFACTAGIALAQAITVLPVTIQMQPGQRATSLTVINESSTESSVQIRTFTWSQDNGKEVLTASDDVVASPPITTIAPGAIQTVRVVVRQAPAGKEASYRILLDQIPPAAAAPGTVRIAVRLSIPVFATPQTRIAPHLAFHVESAGGKSYLVAANSGTAHETLRDISLTARGGGKANVEASSPYVLAGATQRWAITSGVPSASGATMHLTAHGVSGEISEDIPVTRAAP